MQLAISFSQISLYLPLSNLPHTYPLHECPLHIDSTKAPYVSFMCKTLLNNSHVFLDQVGVDGKNSLHCHTDLETCCNRTQGADRGDWYFPNRTRLQFNGDGGDIYQFRHDKQVDLRRRNNAIIPYIYCCRIETNDTRSDNDSDTTTRETVCVGLFSSAGECTHMCM